ncbi:nitroreductase family protein [Psychromicrobium xiongbiense]|uniref:nitroreductase family protein n=1 Tax=Psychromicrobium xiongbiense TaxID=3051184 RepID=UPI002555F5CC|nr:nitroreductase family protein [Psychromicrobium sp. YIM S02556]
MKEQLAPALQARWSPSTWDASHELSEQELELLLEAARWAPSAGNSQPWAFLPALRSTQNHARILPFLAPSSAMWAPQASVLFLALRQISVQGSDLECSEFAQYDLGQAVAHLTIQAQSMGLHSRQFRAFNLDGLSAEFAVPAHWAITTMVAVGRLPADVLPHAARKPDGTLIPRDRMADIRFTSPFNR